MTSRTLLQSDVLKIASDLEKSLDFTSNTIDAVEGAFAVMPAMANFQFRELARRLIQGRDEIKLVTGVRNKTVRYVYPMEGNEHLFESEYQKAHPSFASIQSTLFRNGTTLSGPANVNGEPTLSAKRAVRFYNSDVSVSSSLWGFITLQISLLDLLDSVGISDAPFDIAIRGRDGHGAGGALFYGQGSVFTGDPVLVEINLPQGRWQLAARPSNGWMPAASDLANIRMFFAFSAVALLFATMIAIRLLQLKFRSEDYLMTAVNCIPDGFVSFDADERLIVCNDRYKELYDKSAELMKRGRKFEDILTTGVARGQIPEAVGHEDEWVAERLALHRLPEHQTEQLLDNGRWLQVRNTATPDGGRVGLRIDITDLKLAQVEAEKANKAKSEFLHLMSQELRAPLTVVLGGTPFLNDPSLLPAGKKLLAHLDDEDTNESLAKDMRNLLSAMGSLAEKIDRSAKNLLSIINDILDYTNLEADKMVLNRGPVELNTLFGSIVAQFRPEAVRKGITLEWEASSEVIWADSLRMRQVLGKIVEVAVQQTEKGGVTLEASQSGADVMLCITDTGAGYTEVALEKASGNFAEVTGADGGIRGGTGLGLVLSKKFIELHGGQVTVSSTEGQGTKFYFTIPKYQEQQVEKAA